MRYVPHQAGLVGLSAQSVVILSDQTWDPGQGLSAVWPAEWKEHHQSMYG